MRVFEIVVALVVVATVVATLAERFRTPAPSLLVLVGLAIGLIPGLPNVQVSPEVIAFGVLPPLLYAAATDVALRELRTVIGAVSVLAVGLVVASAVAIALVAHGLYPQLSLAAGLVLGAVLASTDPIAVGALARRMHLPPRLLALVQGESLLNDATSLVLFRVSVGLATAGAGSSVAATSLQFVRLGGGGVLIGLLAAYGTRRLRSRIDDPVLETVVALITPYAVYVGAEAAGCSGVTAVVVTGLYLGDRERGLGVSSGRARLQISGVYSVVQFLLESVVFAVIGLQLPTLVRRLAGEDQHFVLGALAIIATTMVMRLVWVYPGVLAVHWFRRWRGGAGSPISWRVPMIITWVGTRGVVPLAAALSIPLTVSGSPFPHRDLLLVLTSSCIMVTLVVQGLTLEPLVRRLGISEDPAARARDEAVAQHAAASAALARLADLIDLDAIPEMLAARLSTELEHQVASSQQRLPADGAHDGQHDQLLAVPNDDLESYRAVRRDLLAVETTALLRLHADGTISETARRQVQYQLDVREAGLGR